MNRKKLYNILIFVCLSIMIFSIYQIVKIQYSYYQGQAVYKNLNQYAEEKDIENQTTNTLEEEKDELEINFEELEKINSDVVGWIYLEDSKINYPIVQGKDNEYYLRHMVNKEYNIGGSIFMDMRNKSDFTDTHSIIYGHHMNNGTMFTDITKYKDQEYYNNHKTGKIITKNKTYEIEFFAGYVTDVYANSWEVNLKTSSDWYEWAKKSKQKSNFQSDITIAEGDKYITLSTCSYDFNDARYVLVGKIKE